MSEDMEKYYSRKARETPGRPVMVAPFVTHHKGEHCILAWEGETWLFWRHPDGEWVSETKVVLPPAHPDTSPPSVEREQIEQRIWEYLTRVQGFDGTNSRQMAEHITKRILAEEGDEAADA